MIECKKCGEYSGDGYRFCEKCGAPLTEQNYTTPEYTPTFTPPVQQSQVVHEEKQSNGFVAARNSYGEDKINLLKLFAVILAVAMIFVGLGIGIPFLEHNGSEGVGILSIFLGILLGVVVYKFIDIYVQLYLNVAMIGENTDRQEIYAQRQLEVLLLMQKTQESMINQLKDMNTAVDGVRKSSGQTAEVQEKQVEKLIEISRQQAELIAIGQRCAAEIENDSAANKKLREQAEADSGKKIAMFEKFSENLKKCISSIEQLPNNIKAMIDRNESSEELPVEEDSSEEE